MDARRQRESANEEIVQTLTLRLMEMKETINRVALEMAEKTLKHTDARELHADARFLRNLQMRLASIERTAKMRGLEPTEIYEAMRRGGEAFEAEFARMRRAASGGTEHVD